MKAAAKAKRQLTDVEQAWLDVALFLMACAAEDAAAETAVADAPAQEEAGQ